MPSVLRAEKPNRELAFALQRGEVEQRRAACLVGLLFSLYLARLAVALGPKAVRLALFPDAFRSFVGVVGIFLERLIKPPAGVLAGGRPEGECTSQ
ncbi:MAG: hypothetical protein Ct9H300mP32_4050 [Verrucomicrobiota bacterium]|nr:MAG: hypothetical protein Ct9H300mP32_4050 [Verrucomicrobiota bacterium]